MGTLLVRGKGLDAEENRELNNLVRKWNRKRRNQHRGELSYLMHLDRKKWYSRDMYQRLYHKKN